MDGLTQNINRMLELERKWATAEELQTYMHAIIQRVREKERKECILYKWEWGICNRSRAKIFAKVCLFQKSSMRSFTNSCAAVYWFYGPFVFRNEFEIVRKILLFALVFWAGFNKMVVNFEKIWNFFKNVENLFQFF